MSLYKCYFHFDLHSSYACVQVFEVPSVTVFSSVYFVFEFEEVALFSVQLNSKQDTISDHDR